MCIMQKILILEDDEIKYKRVLECLHELLGTNYEYCHYKAFNIGCAEFLSGDYCLGIIDNNMPRFYDDMHNNFVTDGVYEILANMEFEEVYTPVIACSSDDIKLNEDYPNYIGTVKYAPNIDIKEKFNELLEIWKHKYMNK